MKTKTKAPKTLTLSKETIRALAVRSSIQTGNDYPSFQCSNMRNCGNGGGTKTV